MKLSMRNRIIAAILGVVVLSLAVLFLLIWPQFQKIGQLSDDIKAQDVEIQSARALLDKRMEAKDNAAKTSAVLILITNRLPDAPELPSLIIEVQDAADAAGMTLERIAPEVATEDGGSFTAYRVNLNLSGRWADYIDFLRRLGKMTRGVRVVSADVAREDLPATAATVTAGAEQETEVAVTMVLEVYTISASASSGATLPPPVTTP